MYVEELGMRETCISRAPHHTGSYASDLLFQPPYKGVATIQHRCQGQHWPYPMEQTPILGHTVEDVLEVIEKLLEE